MQDTVRPPIKICSAGSGRACPLFLVDHQSNHQEHQSPAPAPGGVDQWRGGELTDSNVVHHLSQFPWCSHSYVLLPGQTTRSQMRADHSTLQGSDAARLPPHHRSSPSLSSYWSPCQDTSGQLVSPCQDISLLSSVNQNIKMWVVWLQSDDTI